MRKELPLTLSPSNFCRSGSTPVRVLRNCLRSSTVSSSESVVTEYSCPPHFTMIGRAILETYVEADLVQKKIPRKKAYTNKLKYLKRCIQMYNFKFYKLYSFEFYFTT